MSTTWEDVEVPQGTFIGWGSDPGQEIALKVLEYSNDAGSDFFDKPCPRIVGELIEDGVSYRDKGAKREVIAKGELVTLNCGLANLARNVKAAQPEPGDLIQIRFDSLEKAAKGDVKVFKTRIARGAAKAPAPADDDLI